MRELIPVKAARVLIKQMLLGHSASIYLKVGDEQRLLMHQPGIHAPSQKLPWPLSLLQTHDVLLVVYDKDNNDIRPRQTFKRGQIDQAIEEFLERADPNQDVLISDNRNEY